MTSRYRHVQDRDARNGLGRLLRWARWARQCARRVAFVARTTTGAERVSMLKTVDSWTTQANLDIAAAHALAGRRR